MRSRPLDKDKLAMTSRDATVMRSLRLLHVIQNDTPEEMVAAIAMLFSTVVNRVGLDPQWCHQLGVRMVRHHQHHDKHNMALQSLRDFAGMRIAGQEVVQS